MRDPRALIDTKGLATSLGDPSLRVFDCTTYLEPTPAGSAEPYVAVIQFRVTPGVAGSTQTRSLGSLQEIAQDVYDGDSATIFGMPSPRSNEFSASSRCPSLRARTPC